MSAQNDAIRRQLGFDLIEAERRRTERKTMSYQTMRISGDDAAFLERLSFEPVETVTRTVELPEHVIWQISEGQNEIIDKLIETGEVCSLRLATDDGEVIYVKAKAARIDARNVRFDVIGLCEEESRRD